MHLLDRKNFFNDLYLKITENSETGLSPYATKCSQASRINFEIEGPRSPFALDRDRILYSGAFRRYSGKTQVIYFASQLDEMLSSRSIHTLSVSQISRTIGKFLSLNQELIEAIALAHDLGHPPFGHDGESFLSNVCQEYGIGEYHHHLQSLHIVDKVAKKGRGLNLTLQVRDGILSHDGEVHDQKLEPDRTKCEQNLQSYIESRREGKRIDMMPMTMEGCVVRITDTIAYVGQDIEDAVRIGLIKLSDIPGELRKSLGKTNGEIIDTLVWDIVYNSCDKAYVCFSSEISEKLLQLKNFNYEYIYHSKRLKKNKKKIELGFNLLFDIFMKDLKNENKNSRIYKHFLNSKHEKYVEETGKAEKVRDFISGMTDRYFAEVLKDIIIPDMDLLNLRI